jgi:hypothetical protein
MEECLAAPFVPISVHHEITQYYTFKINHRSAMAELNNEHLHLGAGFLDL